MALYGLPESAHIWPRRNTLENNGGCANGEGCIKNIRVPRNPSNVCGTPINLPVTVLECRLERIACVHHVPSAGMHHAFWFSGRTGGVKNKKQIL